MASESPKSKVEMYADSLREAGMLILTFGFLHIAETQGVKDWTWVAVQLVLAAGAFYGGMYLELRRKKPVASGVPEDQDTPEGG